MATIKLTPATDRSISLDDSLRPEGDAVAEDGGRFHPVPKGNSGTSSRHLCRFRFRCNAPLRVNRRPVAIAGNDGTAATLKEIPRAQGKLKIKTGSIDEGKGWGDLQEQIDRGSARQPRNSEYPPERRRRVSPSSAVDPRPEPVIDRKTFRGPDRIERMPDIVEMEMGAALPVITAGDVLIPLFSPRPTKAKVEGVDIRRP